MALSQNLLAAGALAGFLSFSVLAKPAQAQSSAAPQPMPPAKQHDQINVAGPGAFTILKTPAIPANLTNTTLPSLSTTPQMTAAGSSLTPAAGVKEAPAPAVSADSRLGTPASSTASSAGADPASAQAQADALALTPAQRRTYLRASSAFVDFCHEWERLLHEREVNNLEHLSWQKDGGLETANYTGYGKVESCECKESKEGLPIGTIRYDEINYAIVGKTMEEARHAAPKPKHEVKTLEIFSWDKGKWFY